MTNVFKFGVPTESGEDVPYEYGNVWAREKTSGPDRLVIAPHSNQIDILNQLADCLDEPFLLLYVLVVSRSKHQPGRYESHYSFTSRQLHTFLHTYETFLEKDARHNLWIRPESGSGLLVYDRHNVIYAYGALDALVAKLNSIGLTEVNEIRFNFPHTHHYNGELDSMQERILSDEKWTISHLRTGDENPDQM